VAQLFRGRARDDSGLAKVAVTQRKAIRDGHYWEAELAVKCDAIF
jgi:hypothetical protein